jgi:hypothetical protein
VIRASRDVSPGGFNRRLEEELSAGRETTTRLYLPYDAADRFVMRMMGDADPPTHYLRVTTFRAR